MFIFMFISILVPLILGIVVHFLKTQNKKLINIFISSLSSLIVISVILLTIFSGQRVELFKLTDNLLILFKNDGVSNFFAIIISVIFLLVSLYAFRYFEHDENSNKFFSFYLMSEATLLLLCYSGNLITLYLGFEMLTLLSMPLVLYDKTKESIRAAIKYLIYSIGGAFLGLFAVFVLYAYTTNGCEFVLGGSLDLTEANAHKTLILVSLLLAFIGFGTKAGMFPLQEWLPTAHPVAPAPASAVLSGIITKAGVLFIVRILFFIVGTDFIKGTWLQYTWITLILITILLGSGLALLQNNFKKRLAYSSVSQLSYILLGISLLNEQSLAGSFIHIASHACIKVCLFLVAGIMIHNLQKHNVDELTGVGKQMPITMWCYTICSLGLIGIPPTGPFTSKWYLAMGALNSGSTAVGIIACIVLLTSAVFTALYLLPITIKAFFPGDKNQEFSKVKENKLMSTVLIILTVSAVLIGIFSNYIIAAVQGFLF